MRKNKKAQSLAQLPAMAVILAVTAIVLSISSEIVDEVQTGFTSASFAYNNSEEGLKGLNELAGWQDTIGLIIGAAVIIALVVGAFRFAGGGM